MLKKRCFKVSKLGFSYSVSQIEFWQLCLLEFHKKSKKLKEKKSGITNI